jgi:long-chain acyl-CoA synthetase
LQVAALIYTSGTSGAPKGVMLSHANILFTARSARDLRGLRPGDVSYGLLPMAHIVGLAAQFMGYMAAGACVLLEPRFTPAETARALAEEGITALVGVPAVYARLLEWAR